MPVPVKCLLPPDSYACRNGTRHSHPAIERRSAFGSSPSRKAPQDHEADTIRGQAERLCSPIRGWVPLPCLSLSVLCVDWSDGTVGSTHTARGERKQPEAALQRSSRAAMGSMLRSRLRKIAPGVVKTAVDLEMVKRVTVMFDPIQPSSRSARDFLAMLKGPKVRSRFPDVSLEEVIREDRGESTVTVEYEHGERLQYKTDKIETPALLKAFREDSNMAAIRGYLQKAGLRLEDWGKPGFPRVWVSKEVRDDPEIEVVESGSPQDNDPNIEEERRRKEMAARMVNPLKASKKNA